MTNEMACFFSQVLLSMEERFAQYVGLHINTDRQGNDSQ